MNAHTHTHIGGAPPRDDQACRTSRARARAPDRGRAGIFFVSFIILLLNLALASDRGRARVNIFHIFNILHSILHIFC